MPSTTAQSSPLDPPSSESIHATLTDLEACEAFVKASSAQAIASQLQHDRDLCGAGKFPSLLVYALPPRSAKQAKPTADEIALAVAANLTRGEKIPLAVARMLYSELVDAIKKAVANMPSPYEQKSREHAEPVPVEETIVTDPEHDNQVEDGDVEHDGEVAMTEQESIGGIPGHLIPTDADYISALKVLSYLQLPQVNALRGPSTPLSTVEATIHQYLDRGPALRAADLTTKTNLLERTDLTNDVRDPRDAKNYKKDQKKKVKKCCYICRYTITHQPHKFYPSLCVPCGDFNMSSSALSTPQHLNLKGFVALVTGARVNLGFHTALRLLRCGAHVIATSRYPYDAQHRYRAEKDWNEWHDRLRIVGADFRTARDVFQLVKETQEILDAWQIMSLRILINNAAQTLTDKLAAEEAAVDREKIYQREEESAAELEGTPRNVVVGKTYQPRIRGGLLQVRAYAPDALIQPALTPKLLQSTTAVPSQVESDPPKSESDSTGANSSHVGVSQDDSIAKPNTSGSDSIQTDFKESDVEPSGWEHTPSHWDDAQLIVPRPLTTDSPLSSWTQTLDRIPYEDVISAHSVNTFVPFILIRELLPLFPSMRWTKRDIGAKRSERVPTFKQTTRKGEKGKEDSKPFHQYPHTPEIVAGYIVNVSSREGLFEKTPYASAKSGLHVHTNMSKAALNMITETLAASTWKDRRVAMNSVDPGYMSADPQYMAKLGRAGEPQPIGWEDGAGRVLWPIVKGERGEVVWGRFYKHFREIEVIKK